MAIDIRTLLLAASIILPVLAGASMIAARRYPPPMREALGFWGAAVLLQALSSLLIALRGLVSDWWSVVAANVLLAVSLVLMLRACRLYAGLPAPSRWLRMFPLWMAVLASSYVLLKVPIPTRIAVSSPHFGVFMAMNAIAFWSVRRTSPVGAGLAFVLSVTGVLVMLWRTLEALSLDAAPHGMFDATWGQAATFVYILAAAIVTTFALLLMCSDRLNLQLSRMAAIDRLTGALNRGALEDRGRQAIVHCQNGGGDLALAFIDIDHFKSINDRHGHDAGDRVLRAVANVLHGQCREGESLSRYGGEEFVLLLPGLDEAQAFERMEGLRSAVASTLCPHGDGAVRVTVSVGVTGWSPVFQFEHFCQQADAAMYEAKRRGRNQVVAYGELTAGTESLPRRRRGDFIRPLPNESEGGPDTTQR